MTGAQTLGGSPAVEALGAGVQVAPQVQLR